MATVWIPSLMRNLTGGQGQIEVSGRTVGDLVDALDALYPGIRDRLCEGDTLNPALMVILDGVTADRGLLAKVKEDSEVHFVPAVSGG